MRRAGGGTLAEEWLLDASSVLVRGTTGFRETALSVRERVSTLSNLRAENEALRTRITSQQVQLHALREARLERDQLVKLLRRRPVAPGGDPPRADRRRRDRRTLPDRAPGPGPRRRHVPGGAVVGEAGLLGRVVAAGERGARVQLLSDRTAATGILLTRTSRAAVARGDGASGANLQYVPAIADVAVDDEVTSSGTDGIYPRGLLVGRIGAVRRPGSSLFLELPVTLAADPMNETLVFVFPPVKPDAPAPASGAPLPARPSP